MRRTILRLTLIAGLAFAGANLAVPTPASACPMCQLANENGDEESKEKTPENVRPKAYMYSILFMLSMPAVLVTGFSIGFYRLSKRKAAEELANAPGSTHHIADDSQ